MKPSTTPNFFHDSDSDAEPTCFSELVRSETSRQPDSCGICHLPIDDESAGFRSELACSHRFHEHCLARFLKAHGTCPTCNKLVPGSQPKFLLGCDSQACDPVGPEKRISRQNTFKPPSRPLQESPLKRVATFVYDCEGLDEEPTAAEPHSADKNRSRLVR